MATETDIKNATLSLVSLGGPELGILALFIGLLWPERQEDPWDRIRERTEKLINDRLDQDAYQRLKQRLVGIRNVLSDYSATILEDTEAYKKFSQFQITHSKFVGEIPGFQEETHARILLPMFVQCANLHLSFLKLTYVHGPERLGFGPDDVKKLKFDLDTAVDSYTAYVQSIIAKGPALSLVDPCDLYVQQMTIDVSDYLTLWPYMKSDGGIPADWPLTREVYSTKIGVNNPVSADNRPLGQGYFPPVPLGEKLTRLLIWGGGTLDAVEEWHGTMDKQKAGYKRGGPGGKPYVEHFEPWSTSPCDIDLEKREIRALKVYFTPTGHDSNFGDVVGGIEFTLDDGSTQTFMGSENWCFVGREIRVPDDHYVSSVNVVSVFNDKSRGHLTNDLVRTLYFGFRLKSPLAV